MTTRKEKIFRMTPENEERTIVLIQYAHKAGYISNPTFQEFMEFTIRCADAVLEQDFKGRTPTEQRRRPII